MNKTTASILASLVALLTGLASLDVTGVLPLLGQFLPESAVKIIAVVPPLAAVIVHAIVAAKRKLESDSEALRSRHNGPSPVILVMAAAACMLLPSCMIALDPSTGRFGVHTDPKTVTELVERITARFNEELQEDQPLVVPTK